MYTSSEHIILYLQDIDSTGYCATDIKNTGGKSLYHLRVVPVKHSSMFFTELETVYGIKSSLDDDNLYVLYNSGDLYERLICDLKFKKFKDMVKFVSVTEGIWLTMTCGDTKDWYHNALLPWIKARISTYVDDLGEPSIRENIKDILYRFEWSNLCVDKYVKAYFDEDDIQKFELLGVEKTRNNTYILSEHHILSLLASYANLNYGRILAIENDGVKTDTETNAKEALSLSVTNNFRGVESDKVILTNEDMFKLCDYFKIDDIVLRPIITGGQFAKLQYDMVDAQTCFLPSETSVFGSKYSFLEGFDLLSHSDGDITEAYKHPPIPLNARNMFRPLFADEEHNLHSSEKTTTSEGKSITFFKNRLNNSIRSFNVPSIEDFPQTLKEFDKISDFKFRSNFTSSIVDMMNERVVTDESINELLELVNILSEQKTQPYVNEEALDDHSKPDIGFLQRILTKSYVDKYKNDALETLASVVIDNVYQYLRAASLEDKCINKNQIGKDLVELGVMKTRKTKGYVYGIEDTKQKKDTARPMFEIDHSKVEKRNLQLRSQIQQPAMNVDPLLFTGNTPASFLIPNKKFEMGLV